MAQMIILMSHFRNGRLHLGTSGGFARLAIQSKQLLHHPAQTLAPSISAIFILSDDTTGCSISAPLHDSG